MLAFAQKHRKLILTLLKRNRSIDIIFENKIINYSFSMEIGCILLKFKTLVNIM